ncbi:MAG: ankyrin repeat domain-containing protein, partial [Anaerolineae bacterium]|nr:ankyrin repeat domain-containing protein [Anaerolineae bacterium]NIN97616.1 ankyrin repeat domain-containing protein [Anaerolineae bacterium]
FTPLHKAAFGGNVELARLLLERGADVAAMTDDGRTPLDIAIERGHAELADVLRRHGASR